MVALLAEGVDRNYEVSGKLTQGTWSPSSRRAWIEIRAPSTPPRRKTVALLAEGVDRNVSREYSSHRSSRSPSSRRAWIEILPVIAAARLEQLSPSSRRAWIEIALSGYERPEVQVALLAEGVDRNPARKLRARQHRASPSSRRAWIEIHSARSRIKIVQGRPPRGGRG